MASPGGHCRAAFAGRQDRAAGVASSGHRLPEMTGRLRKAVLTTAAPAAAGPFCWYFTRSPAVSLGVMVILAVVTLVAAFLTAREETTRVKVREQGATDRERIRYQGENRVAEADWMLAKAATSGPSSSAEDARALRLDARKALKMRIPTTVADAMRITRLQEIEDRPQPPGPVTGEPPGSQRDYLGQ